MSEKLTAEEFHAARNSLALVTKQRDAAWEQLDKLREDVTRLKKESNELDTLFINASRQLYLLFQDWKSYAENDRTRVISNEVRKLWTTTAEMLGAK
jgi:hypothetical protein